MARAQKSRFRKLIRIIFYILLIPTLYVGGVLVYGTLTDYQPELFTKLPVSGKGLKAPGDTLSLVTWNLGYGGQGKEMDFFYDGGTQVRVSEELQQGYFAGIRNQLTSMDSVDIFLLQEIDSLASRSYRHNQINELAMVMPNYTYTFAKNYDCKFVPKPWLNPLGSVVSGIATFSRIVPDSATRYSYPGNFAWPKRVFLLDRCFLATRYLLASGKELVVINTHNSAFDQGELKKLQMEKLYEYSIREYEKGNYVVIGGDFNQCPPYFPAFSLSPVKRLDWNPQNMNPALFPEDWLWIYDPIIPTQRAMNVPYDGRHNFQTIIDYFLVSPNIEAIKIKGIHHDFAFSDHQPVFMKIRLKP